MIEPRSRTKPRSGRSAAFLVAAAATAALLAMAETPASGPMLSFTASTANVVGAGDSIRIELFRWSTDAERDQLVAAWNLTAPAGPRRGGSRRAGARSPSEIAPDPAAEDDGPPRARPTAGARSGAVEPPRQTPEGSLEAALLRAPTIGYLWSSEVTGYAVHSAVRLPEPDGGERIILITDRRLGLWNDLWKPAGSAVANSYPFSVIELRVNAKGDGEGKVSLTGKVAVDDSAKAIGLEDYGAAPVILKNVRRRTG